MSPYCPKCGAENLVDSNFCKSCGAPLTFPKEVATLPPPPPPSDITSIPPEYSTPPPQSTIQLTDAQLMTARKNEAISVLLTFIFPGLGHLYVGRTKRGVGYIFVTIAFLFFTFLLVLFILPMIVWYLFCVVQSYELTKRYNKALLTLRRPPDEYEF